MFKDYKAYNSEDYVGYSKINWIDEEFEKEHCKDFLERCTEMPGDYLIECNQPVHSWLWNNPNFKLEDYNQVTNQGFSEIYKTILIPIIDTPFKPDIGIQIRCGDSYSTHKKSHCYIPAKSFDAYSTCIANFLNEQFLDKIIFLTSDCEEFNRILIKKFPCIKTLPRERACHFDMSIGSNDELDQVVTEHMILSKSSAIITKFNSNFGITAALIGGIRDLYTAEYIKDDLWSFFYRDFIQNPRLKTRVKQDSNN